MTTEATEPGDGLKELGEHYRSLVDGELVGWDAVRPFRKCLGVGGQGVVYLSERRGVDGFTIPVALQIFEAGGFTTPPEYSAEMA